MNRQLTRSPSTKSVISGATVRASGERELILTTLKPDPNVPAALADEDVFPVYDVEAVEAAGGDREKLLKSGGYTGAYK
jgi:peptide/nickel transport system substrate-binding protein